MNTWTMSEKGMMKAFKVKVLRMVGRCVILSISLQKATHFIIPVALNSSLVCLAKVLLSSH